MEKTHTLPSQKIFIFGAGPIGIEHRKAFNKLGCEVCSVSKFGGKRAVSNFKQIDTIALNDFDFASLSNTGVVIALPIEQQLAIYKKVIEFNPKFVLIEKPFTLEINELEDLLEDTGSNLSKTFVAFNRRFYEPIQVLRRILDDSEIYSIAADFSENIPRLVKAVQNQVMLDKWHIANSSHIMDLIIYLTQSERLNLNYRYLNGSSNFSSHRGYGFAHLKNQNNVDIETKFNFMCSGSWNIEVSASSGRFKLAPLEKLLKFNTDNFQFEVVAEEDTNINYKAGFLKQASALLNGNPSLCSLKQNYLNVKSLSEIFE